MDFSASNGDTKRIFNCHASNQTKDWTITSAAGAGVLPDATVTPKPAVDLRTGHGNWIIQNQNDWDVGNQEDTGACVAFAVADSALRWHFAKAGKIKISDHFSTRYLWMASKETDEDTERPTTFIESYGTTLKNAIRVVQKYGIVKEKMLKFDGHALYNGDAAAFYAKAAQFRIASYYNLGVDVLNWKRWLSYRGPVLARMVKDDAFTANARVFASDPTLFNATINNFNPDTINEQEGHAIALVGYTRDGKFIVRNSYGDQWGDSGYGFVSEDYALQVIKESYGISLADDEVDLNDSEQ